jgi:hypothetical protein
VYPYVTYVLSLCLLFLVPALTLWMLGFRFVPFCMRMYREAKASERELAATEERVMRKAVSLRERHDLLLDALETLVGMHRSVEAAGNWDWALARAEKALQIAKTPLLESAEDGDEP